VENEEAANMKYEAVIGLEVHAQLKTRTKMFCSCSTSFGDRPNSNICPVCTGQPGTLPVVNKNAIEMAIKTGLAVGCTINTKSIFARKNYFYPDLPKGYQISQHEFPLCTMGYMDITYENSTKRIGITRIHLEEDTGKLMHDMGNPNESHVDFNRCGVPLIEIVSEPDVRNPKEAGEYLRTLRNVLVYLDVCEGNLQEGNFRCDANVSIRPMGQEKFGTRSEIKNLNSFKAVERAIAYEIERQVKLLDSEGKIVQETRLWNDAAGKTESLRSKEEAHDYRYFPDPDLLPLKVSNEWIEKVRKSIPELALERSARFVSQYSIPRYDADVLTDEKSIADYFEDVVKSGAPPKKASNWVMGEILRQLNEDGSEISACKISPAGLAQLISLIEKGVISGTMAKEVFAEMYRSGESAETIVKTKGLTQMSDSSEIEKIVDDVIAANQAQHAQYKAGKETIFGFFVGQVMKASKGKANPAVVNELLKKKL